MLSPYTGSDKYFRDTAEERATGHPTTLCYMYNDLLATEKQADLSAVATTVFCISAEDKLANAGHAFSTTSGPFAATFNSHEKCDSGAGASIRYARFRHDGGANVAFADGHLYWFKGGTDDPIFFPPRDAASVSAIDPKMKTQIGPVPGGLMTFQGRTYVGTFYVR